MNSQNSTMKSTEPQQPRVLLEVQGVSFAYGNGRSAVDNVSFDLVEGEIGSVIGPSGCGKSTLLRGIAGFEQPKSGSIRMNGDLLSNSAHSIAPEQRCIGMVFQDYALFPHLSVAENIEFGLRNWRNSERKNRVAELLNLIGMEDFGERSPHSLSGGEQQRIALARAIAPKPRLLLMDEAFSSLDVEICRILLPEVKQILLQEGITSILVTHDHDIAFAIADKIGVMERGRVHQWDVPFNVYHQPINRFTARFIGEGEFIPAVVVGEQMLQTVLGLHSFDNEMELKKDDQVEILLRPDDILHDDNSPLTGQVMRKSFRGSHYLYTVKLTDGQSVYCLADSHHNHRIGEQIGIRLNIEHVVIFEKDKLESSGISG